MTLMSVYAENGEIVGRCDARCYDAEEIECECVCHGCNHGKGLDVANILTTQNSERWIDAYVRYLRLPTHQAEVFGENQRQESLF